MTAVASDLFGQLPDSARLWVFGVGRSLASTEESRLLAKVDGFLGEWKAHGYPLAAAREWLYGHFLLVGVDEQVSPPSGCSIDALIRNLRDSEEELKTEIVGGAFVWYRDAKPSADIRRVSRAEFKKRVETGLISGDTVVFDLSLTRVGELRAGKWEAPARQSWHRRYLSQG